MKKRKIDIAFTIIISLIFWVYFYMNSKPLTRTETILVVGVVFVFVFLVGYLIRKFKKPTTNNEE